MGPRVLKVDFHTTKRFRERGHLGTEHSGVFKIKGKSPKGETVGRGTYGSLTERKDSPFSRDTNSERCINGFRMSKVVMGGHCEEVTLQLYECEKGYGC